MEQFIKYQARQQRHIALQKLYLRKQCGEPVGRAKSLPTLADSYIKSIMLRVPQHSNVTR